MDSRMQPMTPTDRPIRKSDRRLTDRARDLRHRGTLPERLLWGILRDRRLGGLKFRRQTPIGPYVVDYYCAEARIVVELDGRSHDGRLQQDIERQRYIEARRLRVVRVANDEVLADVSLVGEGLLRACAAGGTGALSGAQTGRPSPQPSPQRGEGGEPCP